MTFIVKYAPVLKEWRFCCCSCNLRAASIVLAWFAAVSSFRSNCEKLKGSVYEKKFDELLDRIFQF
jgi:hypothetical protein